MENKHVFDTTSARQFCMERGTMVGVLTSLSFLCSMYGLQISAFGLLSNVLGVLAVWVAARSIRLFRTREGQLSFGRTCWMALTIYLFTILLTAAVQFVYFQFLDDGRLATQVRSLLEIPEYRTWLSQMTAGEDVDEIVGTMLSMFASPARATMQMMWMNCVIALLLVIPTAFFGMIGGKSGEK